MLKTIPATLSLDAVTLLSSTQIHPFEVKICIAIVIAGRMHIESNNANSHIAGVWYQACDK